MADDQAVLRVEVFRLLDLVGQGYFTILLLDAYTHAARASESERERERERERQRERERDREREREIDRERES